MNVLIIEYCISYINIYYTYMHVLYVEKTLKLSSAKNLFNIFLLVKTFLQIYFFVFTSLH